MAETRAASFLSPPEMFRLDLACAPLREAFPDFGPYLVGSVTTRRDFRDVDVRLVMKDKQYDRLLMAVGIDAMRFLNLAIAAYLRDSTGLNVDFQIQKQSTANDIKDQTTRNPLGTRGLANFRGDAMPDADDEGRAR